MSLNPRTAVAAALALSGAVLVFTVASAAPTSRTGPSSAAARPGELLPDLDPVAPAG